MKTLISLGICLLLAMSHQTHAQCNDPFSSFAFAQDQKKTSLTIYYSSPDPAGYLVEYGEIGFRVGSGLLIGGQKGSDQQNITIDDLTPNTTYRVIIYELCGADLVPMQVLDLNTLSECEPTQFFQLRNTEVGGVSFEVSTLNENSSYVLEYGLVGFERGTGLVSTGNLFPNFNQIELEDSLMAGTTYQMFFRETCPNGTTLRERTDTIRTLDYCASSSFFLVGASESRTGANLFWNSFLPGKPFEIQYSIVPLDSLMEVEIQTLSGISETDNNLMINNLDSETSYQFTLIEACAQDEFTSPTSRKYTTPGECGSIIGTNLANDYNSKELILTWQTENFTYPYEIEFGPAGFEAGSGTLLTGVLESLNTALISPLTPNTSYDVYLKELCPTQLITADLLGAQTSNRPSPINDECSGAIEVMISESVFGTINGASSISNPELNEIAALSLEDIRLGVWYRYNATSDEHIKFSLNNEVMEFDAVMEIYSGDGCADLSFEKVINEVSRPPGAPEIVLPTQAGQSYYILITGENINEQGVFALVVSEEPNYVPCQGASGIEYALEGSTLSVSWESGHVDNLSYLAIGQKGFVLDDFKNDIFVLDESKYGLERSFSTDVLPMNTELEILIIEKCKKNSEIIVGQRIPLVIETVTEVGASPKGLEVLTFPNPASDFIVVETPAPLLHAELLFFDLRGKKMSTSSIEGSSHRVNIEHLAPGVYSYMILSKNQPIHGKFIKE